MPESRLSLDRRLVSTLLVTVCRLLTGIRSRWHSEPEPEKTRIYYANHSSHLDGLVIWASLPPQMRTRVHPVAAADYWLGSRLRRYLALRIFGAVLVERRPAGEREVKPAKVHSADIAPVVPDADADTGSPQQANGDISRMSLQKGHIEASDTILSDQDHGANSSSMSKNVLLPLKQALDGQHSLILFPEGTRGSGEQLNSFKSGLYHLSKAYPQVELVPVWLDNLNRVLPKGSRLVVPIICSATFGTPLPGVAEGEDKQAFLTRTKAALEAIAP
ncbi:1-acyl-sn-glycerol-3-phosphate acyltransferase [Erwinia sp. JUb26]|uniref:lysophospholipid acyltransferase family protein n=1 Tax=Erwinia sp. JUb26 TaxID=2485126 RepID=UPI000F48D91E|nr:lysophospholipid acyltransferase family protein [Erwinia sp. JUb26]ROR13812.1 acyltransferase-like protein [Erwinia sp. JUb26]